MTGEQWRRVQQHLLDEAPPMRFPVDAVFDERIRLLGWTVDREQVEPGDEIKLTFYWEALTEITEPWMIFLHLEHRQRQTVDHHAIEGALPTNQWPVGKIIQDEVRVTLRSTFAPGELQIYTGFFRGETRLRVSREGAARLTEDGRLRVGGLNVHWEPPTYQIRYTPRAPQLTGRGDDPMWRRAPRSELFVHPTSGEPVPHLDTTFQALWDEHYLYVFMTGKDTDVWSTITERDGNLWDEEVMEVYLDPGGQGRDYVELQINPLNTQFDALFPRATNRDLERARAWTLEGWETHVHVQGTLNDPSQADEGWSVEMRIPWASLPNVEAVPPHQGVTLRANFYRYDRTRDGGVQTLAWSPVGGGSFHQPDRFGRLVLRGGPAARPAQGEASEGQPETEERDEP